MNKKQPPLQFPSSDKKSVRRSGEPSRLGDIINEERSVLEGTAEAQRRKAEGDRSVTAESAAPAEA